MDDDTWKEKSDLGSSDRQKEVMGMIPLVVYMALVLPPMTMILPLLEVGVGIVVAVAAEYFEDSTATGTGLEIGGPEDLSFVCGQDVFDGSYYHSTSS